MKNLIVCSKCDTIVNGIFCTGCGKLIDKKKPVDRKTVKQKTFVDSFFNKKEELKQKKSNDNKVNYSKKLIIIAILITLVSFLYYYQLVYYSPEKYSSPIVLSAKDLLNNKDIDDLSKNTDANKLVNDTKTLDMQLDLNEGNLDDRDLYNFVPPNANLVINLFNISDVYKKYIDEDYFNLMIKVLDIKEDDINVYLNDNFLLVYPDDDITSYGYVTKLSSEEYISEKVEKFNEKKDLMNEGKIKEDEVIKNTYIKIIKLKKEEEKDEDRGDNYYLLVSNSKEYLDQMKEASEGNLHNINKDAYFVNIKNNLPLLGQGFIYKPEGSKTWDVFADYIKDKVEYVGIEKILKSYVESGLLFYTKDKKLKIISSN